MTIPVGGSPFADVQDQNAYYYDSVMWAVENGITAGVNSFEFQPDAVCTREQVVTFLWRAHGKPDAEVNENAFSDVKAGQYYSAPVFWAVENGITYGTGANRFGRLDPCTRSQVVTFLWRAAGCPEPESEVSGTFTDVSADAYYFKAVQWAVENGITYGVSATAFGSNVTCTRAQIVTFLSRYAQLQTPDDPDPDLDDQDPAGPDSDDQIPDVD